MKMRTEKPIKCFSKDYKPGPFYRIESNGVEKRFVAHFQDAEKIKMLIVSFIDSADTDLQVKIRDFDDPENPKEYEGVVAKAKLKNALEKYEEVFIHDGWYDLMIKQPSTGDYFAFDKHGLIYIYTEDDYQDELSKYGLKINAKEKLIYESGHWHYRPACGREDLTRLINELGLSNNDGVSK